MKIRYLFAILMIILLVGCAKPEVAPEPAPIKAPEPAPVIAPELVPEPIPVVETAPEPVEQPQDLTQEEVAELGNADVALKKSGFDPSEITMKAGGSLRIKVLDDNRHVVSSKETTNFRSGSMTKSAVTEIPLEKAGTYTFLDIPYGNRLVVTVTE